MEQKEIIVSANILADPKKVWDYYTQPVHITNWNFASDDWKCPEAKNDLRVGGVYSARMEAKDGSFGFDFEAVYDEVVEGEKLIYTMTDGRKTTVTFEDEDNNTKVNIMFDADGENPIEIQRDGWQAILNNFKKYVETAE